MTSSTQSSTIRAVLATDLDGTLIPLPNEPQNLTDLKQLSAEAAHNHLSLVYVTGRHFESVRKVMDECQLPEPDWIICDVGTSIYRRDESEEYSKLTEYQKFQEHITHEMPQTELKELLSSVPGLRLQEPEKQGQFKLSYYADADELETIVVRLQQILDSTEAPYSLIHSVDPFNGDGLLDFLPRSVSKAHALEWWLEFQDIDSENLVFAGDSGNDLAALTHGYRSILVGNADRQLARQVYHRHHEQGWTNRLFLAQQKATSGVLEGCRWFGLVQDKECIPEKTGATCLGANRIIFRVWAPRQKKLTVKIIRDERSTIYPMHPEPNGFYRSDVLETGANDRYQFVFEDGTRRPDPVSRFQPEGVHHASQVINSAAFPWTDQSWRGLQKRELVIYELHIGTFSKEGTWQGAKAKLPELVELGITAIELLPVAQSPGRWNWGYDGVNLFAPRNTYGTPEDFKAFIDECHAQGIAVILDVVYNHLGPEGNYLSEFGPYFTSRHHTPWGEALNYDDQQNQFVREFIVQNAIFWLDEYHLDGLRLDAAHFMYDDSQKHILDEIGASVTNFAKTHQKEIHLIAETNVFDKELLTENEYRPAYTGIWCDCLMHSLYSHAVPELKLTRRGYQGMEDIAQSLRSGFLYQGRTQSRVSPVDGPDTLTDTRPERNYLSSLIMALQTHDSVGNHPEGKRLNHLTSVSFQRAAAGLILLYPAIPMIFMGEEFSTESPFPFFADFEDPQLREAVDTGRQAEYQHHDWSKALAPSDERAFREAVLPAKNASNLKTWRWYQQLIKLRRKGLKDGWLAHEYLETEFDPENCLFKLEYKPQNKAGLIIYTRLAVNSSIEPIGINHTGKVLMSSLEDDDTTPGQILMQANHTIISQLPTR